MRVSPIAVDLDVLGRVGVALADETRRRILVRLIDGPAYPSDLADELGSTRANISNHLACLRGCGLVVTQPEGRRVRYELADRRLGGALRDLLGLVLVPDPASCPASADDGCC
jgi:ArsR family transcriptional regulator, cadmium/lead-responsive transcriptional repressor